MSKIFEVPDALKGLIGDPGPDRIYNMDIPQLPELRFEFHPKSKIVYFIFRKVLPSEEVGEPISPVDNKDAARIITMIWARGYLEGKNRPPAPAVIIPQKKTIVPVSAGATIDTPAPGEKQ